MRDVFENLDYIKEFDNEEKDALIHKMYSLSYETFSHKKITMNPFSIFDIQNIDPVLDCERYYIANNYFIFHKKQIIIRGRLVLADKISMLSFFVKEQEQNEEISFSCMPADENANYIITNDDEWNLFYIHPW